MKQFLIGAICIYLFSTCKETNNDPVRSSIPGTYVMPYSNEYSLGNDTLVVTALSKSGNNYRIDRNTTYQRIRKGKVLPKGKKQEQWVCIYNKQDNVLNETTTGRVISFIPERKILLVGNNAYQKISKP